MWYHCQAHLRILRPLLVQRRRHLGNLYLKRCESVLTRNAMHVHVIAADKQVLRREASNSGSSIARTSTVLSQGLYYSGDGLRA